MNNDYMITVDPDGSPRLSHASAISITYNTLKEKFRPKYYKKIIQSNGRPRYFYTEKEYTNWVNRKSRPKNRTDLYERQERQKEQVNLEKRMRERYVQAKREVERKAQQERENAIAQSREKLKQQTEAAKAEQEKARREEAARRQEAVENAEAELRRKISELNQKRKLPEEVSLKDFLFGGSFRKNLKASKKNLKNVQKELKKQNREAAKLDAEIARLSEKSDRLSRRNQQRLEKLKEQRSALQSSINESKKQQLQCIEDYSVALYRYEGATMVGQISKKMRASNRKASRIIEKYSKKLVSSIPKVSIKLKK